MILRSIYQSAQQLLASKVLGTPHPAGRRARLEAAQQAFDDYDTTVVLPLLGHARGLPQGMNFVDAARAIPDAAIQRHYCMLVIGVLDANIALYEGDAAFSSATRGWRKMAADLARVSDSAADRGIP